MMWWFMSLFCCLWIRSISNCWTSSIVHLHQIDDDDDGGFRWPFDKKKLLNLVIRETSNFCERDNIWWSNKQFTIEMKQKQKLYNFDWIGLCTNDQYRWTTEEENDKIVVRNRWDDQGREQTIWYIAHFSDLHFFWVDHRPYAVRSNTSKLVFLVCSMDRPQSIRSSLLSHQSRSLPDDDVDYCHTASVTITNSGEGDVPTSMDFWMRHKTKIERSIEMYRRRRRKTDLPLEPGRRDKM